jgi:hypothetical protein
VQKQTRLQTGIYRHYRRGKLYFAREDIEDFDTHVLGVVFDRLYPVCKGTKIAQRVRLDGLQTPTAKDSEGNPISRFTLVHALPVEKMQLLLPGTRVALSEKGPEYRVTTVFEMELEDQGPKIFVRANTKIGLVDTPLPEFLQKAFLLETF